MRARSENKPFVKFNLTPLITRYSVSGNRTTARTYVHPLTIHPASCYNHETAIHSKMADLSHWKVVDHPEPPSDPMMQHECSMQPMIHPSQPSHGPIQVALEQQRLLAKNWSSTHMHGEKGRSTAERVLHATLCINSDSCLNDFGMDMDTYATFITYRDTGIKFLRNTLKNIFFTQKFPTTVLSLRWRWM